MTDLAVLGLAVDSSQVKAATGDLNKLTTAGNAVEASQQRIKTASGQVGVTFKTVQQMADRAGVSFDEMKSKLEAGVTVVNKASQALKNASGPGIGTGLSSVAARILSNYNAISLVLQGVSAASAAYLALNEANAPTLEKSLEEQARLLGVVKAAYRDAANAAGSFYDESKAVYTLQATINQSRLQEQLAAQTKSILSKNLTDPGALAGYTQEFFTPENIGPALAQIAPFQAALTNLRQSVIDGKPDILAYRDAIAALGNASNETIIKKIANDILTGSQDAADLAVKVKEVERVLRLLNGTATKGDRAGLGLSNHTPRVADPFASSENSINRHIAQMKADAEAVGVTSAEHARLRTQAQLLEAAQRNGGDATDAQKKRIAELGQAASDAAAALARANIASDISFGKQTSFLSSEDVAIASKLRDLYGNDVPAALASSEATALRLVDTMKQLGQAFENDLSNGLYNIISGTTSAKDGFKQMTLSIIQDIEKIIIKMAIVRPLMAGLGGLFGFSDGGYVNPGSSANPLSGLTAADYGVGFASGGYTGAGGKYAPAGIVHRGEYVFDAASTSRIGVGNLERIRRSLPGFADGGYAGNVVSMSGRGQDNSATPAFSITQNIDARGADAQTQARLVAAVAKSNKDLEKNVQAIMVKYRANTPGGLR